MEQDMKMSEMLDHMRSHDKKDEVIDMMSECWHSMYEEFNILIPKMKELNKELLLDNIEDNILTLNASIIEMTKYLINEHKFTHENTKFLDVLLKT